MSNSETTGGTRTAELSYYAQLGGAATIRQAVDRLYGLIGADDSLIRYFDHVHLPTLKAHMAALLTMALGGPGGYEGRDLAEAHHGLKITERDYATVGGYLTAVLRELDAGTEIVAAVTEILTAVRGQIVEVFDQPTSVPGAGG